MGEKTGIQWCDHTFNPWIGCSKVSSGCTHCYAEVQTYPRVSKAQGLPLWGPSADRHETSASNWRAPIGWYLDAFKAAERRRVFCASLADVFEEHPALTPLRTRLWALIERTMGGRSCAWGGLDWLLLTKRPEAIMRLIPERWRAGLPPNVWVGTSVEDQAAADERIPHLLRVPARVRFLSCEPLIGAVNLRGYIGREVPDDDGWHAATAQNFGNTFDFSAEARVDWIIIGGESGPKARPCDVAWVRDVVAQCRAAGCAPFVKQLGAYPRSEHGPDHAFGAGIAAFDKQRILQRDSHGGDPAEWPADLRDERHFPIVRHPGAPEPPPLSHHVEEALGP